MLKAGDIKTIYERPYTHEKPEGKARLVKRLTTLTVNGEDWEVRFPGDSQNVTRRIVENEYIGKEK